MQYVATLLALPLVGSACTWSQATPVTESGSQRANCADWNTYYFFRAAAPKDISTCLAAGADPNAETTNGWTPLHLAASAGKDLTVFQVLMAAGADPAAKNYGGRGATPLEIAVHSNEDAAVIQTLMAADPAIGSSRDWQLLHTARYGTASEVQTLLDAGGDPHVRGTDGRTLLHMAARNKNAAVTHALLDAGVDSRSKDRIGWTPLHLAASNKTVGVTQALLAAGADPNAKGNNGSIPLHHAARSNGNAAVTRALLAAGADPNAETNNGETPLQ